MANDIIDCSDQALSRLLIQIMMPVTISISDDKDDDNCGGNRELIMRRKDACWSPVLGNKPHQVRLTVLESNMDS
jgi:hypothetical protein